MPCNMTGSEQIGTNLGRRNKYGKKNCWGFTFGEVGVDIKLGLPLVVVGIDECVA